MNAMTEQAVAGWYPAQNGTERWWDGTQWTDHHRAAQVAAQPVYVQPQPTRMVTKSRKRTSHTFHLLMTIITVGAWGILVWLPITIIHRFRHDKSVTKIG